MSRLKRTALWGGVLTALVVAPRVAVQAFYWRDGRKVARVPEWLSHQVYWALNECLPPTETWRWLQSPNPLLDGLSPADVLEAGGEDQVLKLIDQLIEARTAMLPMVRTTH